MSNIKLIKYPNGNVQGVMDLEWQTWRNGEPAIDVNQISSTLLTNDRASKILDWVKRRQGMQQLFRDEVGKYMALGLGEGFAKTMPKVIDDMQNSLSDVTLAMAGLSIGDIPQPSNRITQQNFYTTKHITNTTEVVRQPTEVVLEIDKREFGRAVVPAYDMESNRIGVVMA